MPSSAQDRAGQASGAAPPETATLPRLRRLPFFAGAPEETLRRLATHTRWRVLTAGEVVVDTGDAGRDVFFVAEGAVRVVLRNASGDELILNELGAGEFFGELAAIDGIPRSANVTALQRAGILAIPGDRFMELALGTPAIGRRLLEALVARLRAKDERGLEAASLPTGGRVLAELLRLSRDIGGGERRISPPPPQHELAARLGLRRETISRELSKLARSGRLTMRRTAIVLHDAEAIRAEIQRQLRGDPDAG